jgi:hypothetical protein
MNRRTSIDLHKTTATRLKLLGCGLLLLIAGDLQAQLLTKVKFSPLEGYSPGPLYGQPSGGGTYVWTCVSQNTGDTFVNGEGVVHYVQSVSNDTMCVRPDGKQGTLTDVMYWAMPFPAQRKGPVTVTWDWKFFSTNVLLNAIPPDYDPTNNNYQATLQGTDVGFTLADAANRQMGDPAEYAVFNELSTPTRLGSVADSRFNLAYGACGGGGDWNNRGPEFKDGKTLHMKMVAYFGDPASPTDGSYDVWAQREGEDLWRTTICNPAKPACFENFPEGPFPFRRCPGEYDGDVKLDCITLWMNDGLDKYGAFLLIDNIRITGPDPVPAPTLRIDAAPDHKVKLTFTGWLQAADSPQGPYADVALPASSPLTIPADAAAKFYRAEN